MHGNDLQLVECEVYKIIDVSAESEPLEKPDSSKLLEKPDSSKLLEKPWKYVDWTPDQKPDSSKLLEKPDSSKLLEKPGSSELLEKPGSSKLLKKPGSSKLLEKPWRNVDWTPENRERLLNKIQNYEPTGVGSLSQIRVLLIGPIAAGKSSLVNSIKSVFKGRVTNQAMTGSSGISLTTQYRTYQVITGKEGKSLPIIVCDTMGLEETTGEGLHVDDITSILRGHIKDKYQFNTAVALQPEDQEYKKNPGLQNRIHCVVYAIDANKISIMPSKLEDKLTAVRNKVNLAGIPQLVLLTKVDEACSAVLDDVTNVYRSLYIKTKLQEASQRLGIPLSCVVPVKNYSHHLEVDQNSDILLLSAVNQMLRFADDYFEQMDHEDSD